MRKQVLHSGIFSVQRRVSGAEGDAVTGRMIADDLGNDSTPPSPNDSDQPKAVFER